MRPSTLTKREDHLFDALANRREFKSSLYRDGVPRPDIYLAQPVRVLFVFREPNLGNKPFAMDMRAQLRDAEFRAISNGKFRSPGSIRGWWNNKVGALGHAVVHALGGEPTAKSLAQFEGLIERRKRVHAFLFPFGYMQIKKTGGGGASHASEIEHHASTYAQYLKDQVTLYAPHIIIGCGWSAASPARLLDRYVLPAGEECRTAGQRFRWWRYEKPASPLAMLEFNHPAFRGSRKAQYRLLASAVREIATEVDLLR